MSDLVEFLTARLDERERRVLELLEQREHGPLEVRLLQAVQDEIKAVRKRIETYELAIARERAEWDDYSAWLENEPHDGSIALTGPDPKLIPGPDPKLIPGPDPKLIPGPDPKLIPGLEFAIRCDALPYAGHPDYRQEWRP